LASKAVRLGGQAKEKATQVAGEVVSRAAPIAGQARERATELAHKAGPIAAHGVETTADRLDHLTHGKYSDRIKKVSTTIEHLLDRGHDGTNGSSGGPDQAGAADPKPAGSARKATGSARKAATTGSTQKPGTAEEN